MELPDDYKLDEFKELETFNANIQAKKVDISDLPEYLQHKINKHDAICEYIHNLYIAKNRDYGDSVHETYVKYGLTSFLVRLADKLNRATSITQKGNAVVTDEKLRDTLLDMANYAILAVIELDDDQP